LTPDLRPEGPPEELSDRNFGYIGEISWVSEREIVFGGDTEFVPHGSFRRKHPGAAELGGATFGRSRGFSLEAPVDL
jgi:hypothetical protein